NGYAVIPSYITGAMLSQLNDMVINIVKSNQGEYAVLTGKSEIANTLLERIGASDVFTNLLHRIYENGSGRNTPPQSLYQVLRCLSGTTGLRQAYFFHYDSYVVTALLPIITPQGGQTGELVMKPNHRRIRSSYLENLIDKLLVDNRYAQKLFRNQLVNGRGSFTRVPVVPGNLYLFWGYRSLHANEPCDPQKIRATALFHFGDPHADSRLRKFTGRAKVRAVADATIAPA
ncbi:MAG: hypothetical protein POG24_11380, partial [Acidocella sp.]|nr:hypothetical protein [Acidocella sp.]